MKESDFIVTNYDLDFSRALDYGLISWPVTFNRMGKGPYERIQNIVKGLLPEQALQNYLDENEIESDLKGRTIWHKKDQYDIRINDVPLDLKSFFIDKNKSYYQQQLEKYNDSLSFMYDCTALVPADQFVSKVIKHYVFAFTEGHFTDAGSNPCYVHAFWHNPWLKKTSWLKKEAPNKYKKNLGKLVIHNPSSSDASITIYGTSKEKTSSIETVNLDGSEITTVNNYYQVFSLKLNGDIPSKTLKIYTEFSDLEETINPVIGYEDKKNPDGKGKIVLQNDWMDMEMQYNPITFVGWLNKEDFAVVGRLVKRFNKATITYQETKTDNLGCSISDLKPMSEIGNL